MILGNLNYCCQQLANSRQYSQPILWPWRFVIICLRREWNSMFPQHQKVIIKWAIFCEVSLWRTLWCVLMCLFPQTMKGAGNLHCRWRRKVQNYRKLSEQVPYQVPEFSYLVPVVLFSLVLLCILLQSRKVLPSHQFLDDQQCLSVTCTGAVCEQWKLRKKLNERTDKYNSLCPLSFPAQPTCTATDYSLCSHMVPMVAIRKDVGKDLQN